MDVKKGKMFQVECSPECAFMVRSHDKSEVEKYAKEHAKNMHREVIDHKQLNQMIMTL